MFIRNSVFLILCCAAHAASHAQYVEFHAGITAPTFLQLDDDLGYWYSDVAIYPQPAFSAGLRWTDWWSKKNTTSIGIRFSTQNLYYMKSGGRRSYHFETELHIKNTFLDVDYLPLKMRLYKEKIALRFGAHMQIFTSSRITGYSVASDYYYKRNDVELYNNSPAWYENQIQVNIGPTLHLSATIIQRPKWGLGFSQTTDMGLFSAFGDLHLPVRFSQSLGFRYMLSDEKKQQKKHIKIQRIEDKKSRKVEKYDRKIRRLNNT